MTRTKLCDRILPDYTRGEEIFNMVSHIVGAAFGVVALTLCVVFSALKSDAWAVVSSAIYGVSLILLYTMSSVYHGLPLSSPTAKKVMQIMDHCTIYALICGSYTPVLLCSIRRVSPGWGWGLFGFVWLCAIIGTVVSFRKMEEHSYVETVCYILMGLSVLVVFKQLFALSPTACYWIIAEGVCYITGAAFYSLRKARYMHSVFHFFVWRNKTCHFLWSRKENV